MDDMLIYGAGGHAKVIIDIIEKSGQYSIAGLIDDTVNNRTSFYGYPVFTNFKDLYERGVARGLIAIGDNWKRSQVVNKIYLEAPDFVYVKAVHSSAEIGKNCLIEAGTVIMAGSCINVDTNIGNHCIINTKVSLDHDNLIESFASVAPGVTTGGNVRISSFSHIGLGASIVEKIQIGEHTVIGAGSVVTRNIPSYVVAYGSPCKVIRNRDKGSLYLAFK
jgi:sugar O-acyltransferase (sialic acid O-acetyltransferase NeuD family)